jgi:arginase
MKNYDLIGAASGWGAKKRHTELSPEELQKFFIQNNLAWKFSSIVKTDASILETDIPVGMPSLPLIASFCKRLAQTAESSVSNHKIPIVIGGDHSCAVGSWSGIIKANNAYGKFGLIWIDAHMDSHTYSTSPSKAFHGMPVATLLGYGEEELTKIGGADAKIAPENLSLIGIRSFEPEEEKFLKELGVRIYYMPEVVERTFAVVFNEALERATKDTQSFGISLDLDAFDPKYVIATGSLEPNGLSPDEVIPKLKGLLNHPKIAGFEIVEYNPTLDNNYATAKVIINILNSLIA